MFNNSAHNYLTNGTFNIIHGNQYNSWHQSPPQESQRMPPPEEWKMKLYQEYDRIPVGRIKILRTIGESRVREGEYEGGKSQGIRAKRVVHLACLVGEREESHPFLSIAYTGCDAKKAFKRDCIAFSRIRHANFVQLRGFNDSDIPMIIFQEELIPVHHVLERHGHSLRALQCYLSLQASAALITMHEWLETQWWSDPYLCDSVWIQPRKGMIFIGPPGPWPTNYFFSTNVRGTLLFQVQDLNIPALPIDLYNTNILLKYLAEYSSSTSILFNLIAPGHPHSPEAVDDFPKHYHVWAHSSYQPMAKFQSCWTYGPSLFLHDQKLGRNEVEDSLIVMENGMTRYSIKCPRNLDCVSFRFELDLGMAEFESACLSWLSQACSIFSRLNIPTEEWSNYALCNGWVYLKLSPEGSHNVVSTLETPCYLFVLPPLRFFDGYPDIAAWMRGENLYYWSSDATGQSIMPERQRVHLGLPSLVPVHLGPLSMTWSFNVYEFIWKWQEIKGFDPTTTDFARSLGFPILEIIAPVSDEGRGRFEMLSGDANFPSSEVGKGARREGITDVDSFPSGHVRFDEGFSTATENGTMSEDVNMAIDERFGADMDTNMEVD